VIDATAATLTQTVKRCPVTRKSGVTAAVKSLPSQIHPVQTDRVAENDFALDALRHALASSHFVTPGRWGDKRAYDSEQQQDYQPALTPACACSWLVPISNCVRHRLNLSALVDHFLAPKPRTQWPRGRGQSA
jgi:hypothetical protein